MLTDFEGSKQDTPDATPSGMPVYLCSPIPELAGFKLVKFKLRRHFRRNLPRWFLSAFKRKEFVKAGRAVRVQALTMEFIARNTTIPVRLVLDVYSHPGIVYIVQDSQTVSWVPAGDRLRIMMNYIDSFTMTSWHERYPRVWESLLKVAGKKYFKYRTVFSHGDFGPHNIMWRDGKIVVIDWETAGWFLEYWDYVRVHVARGDCGSWWDMFQDVVDRYDDEVDVQNQISYYLE